MKTRILHTKFWEDDYILSLTAKEKLLFNFYISNSHIGMTGIYEISPTLVGLFTALTPKEVSEANLKFSQAGRIRFYENWVKIVNAAKYQDFSGEKNEIAKAKELSDVPDRVLKELDTPSIGYQGVSTTGDTPNNKYKVISNNKLITKGVVKGKIDDLTEEDFQQIAADYQTTVPHVLSCLDDLRNYCDRSGKTYKDYKAALRNFVKKNVLERREDAAKTSKIAYVGEPSS